MKKTVRSKSEKLYDQMSFREACDLEAKHYFLIGSRHGLAGRPKSSRSRSPRRRVVATS